MKVRRKQKKIKIQKEAVKREYAKPKPPVQVATSEDVLGNDIAETNKVVGSCKKKNTFRMGFFCFKKNSSEWGELRGVLQYDMTLTKAWNKTSPGVSMVIFWVICGGHYTDLCHFFLFPVLFPAGH